MSSGSTAQKKRTVYASLQEWVGKALETVMITPIMWSEAESRTRIDSDTDNIYPFAQFVVIGSKNIKSRPRITRIIDKSGQTTMHRSIRGTQTLIGELSIYDTSYQSLIDTAVSLGDLAPTAVTAGRVRMLENRVEALESNVLRCTIIVEFERDIYTDVPIKVVHLDKVGILDPLDLSERN